jgi:hypothetical protein
LPSTPAPPEPKVTTIEGLISKLADIKARQAALEKAEKETIAQIKEQLKQQKERLKKLGVNVEGGTTPPAALAPAPPPPPAGAVPPPLSAAG